MVYNFFLENIQLDNPLNLLSVIFIYLENYESRCSYACNEISKGSNKA